VSAGFASETRIVPFPDGLSPSGHKNPQPKQRISLRFQHENESGLSAGPRRESSARRSADPAESIHRELGPGLLESVYETVLADRLSRNGYCVDRQRPIGIEFDGIAFPAAFRIDLFIDHRLIVEIKSVERLNAAHLKQLLTYLRLTKLPVGLLINFAGATSRKGSGE
jgi:iron complex transport system substrate-binding protein